MEADVAGKSREQAYLESVTSIPAKNEFITPPKYNIVNAPFINLNLLDKKEGGTSLSWRGGTVGSSSAPDYFTSLSHKRIINAACQCTLNLTFVPQHGEDPSQIEAAIWNSRGRCTYQYGMTGYHSPAYAGLIYDYSVTMSEGVLNYKMDLISQEIAYLGATIQDNSYNVPPLDKRKEKLKTWNGADWVSYIIPRIILNYLGNNFYFYDSTFDGANTDNAPYELQSSQLDLVGHNPMKALQMIAQHLYPKNGDPSTFYYIQFDDTVDSKTGKGAIRLMSTSSAEEAQSIVKMYSFLWNNRDSSVLSWAPQYKGTAVIFNDNYREKYLSTASEDKNKEMSEFGVQSDGSYLVETIPNKTVLRNWAEQDYGRLYGSDFEDVIQDNDTMLRKYNEITKYPYKATMTVLGLPVDYVVGAHIMVNPYLNGQLHHTGGEYMVTSITDKVDGSGFTTDLELVKVIKVDTKDDTSKVKSKKVITKGSRRGSINFIGSGIYEEVK